MKKIGIIGLGLIGTSLGLALAKYTDYDIYGYDIESRHLKYNLEKNIIDSSLDNEDIKYMDIIFIAVPVCSIIPVIREINPYINKCKTIITDMGSTKKYILDKISSNYSNIKFIGGHPMAGKEVSGPQSASADLFKNKSYILIKNIKLKKEIKNLKNLLLKIGANINIMDSETHDCLVAMTSHLPQITASALIEQLRKNEQKNPSISQVIGTGFLDMTRIAASNPEMWLDIFTTNKSNIVNQIEEFIDILQYFRDNILEENQEVLNRIMKITEDKRITLKKTLEKGE
ncbi:MAG: prephenate dehydrogenase [Bacillota bacterium]